MQSSKDEGVIYVFMRPNVSLWVVIGIGGHYRGTKVPRYRYRGTFVVPVPSVLLWYRYRYRGTLLFFGGTGTLVLFHFLVGILRT